MRKSLSQLKGKDLELLVSHGESKRSGVQVGPRARWYTTLLLVGISGFSLCLWVMLNTADTEEFVNSIGLTRVANSLENILDLLAYPVLMFTFVLSAYAMQRLHQLYRLANNPERSRR